MNTVTLDRKIIYILIAQADGLAHLVHDADDDNVVIGNEATIEQIEAFALHVVRLLNLDYSVNTEYYQFYQSEEFDHLNYRYVVRFL